MEKPNILIYMMDTQRVKNMGCYGYGMPTTPFIDELAGDSIVFEHHYTNGAWTLPTHASLFTGRYLAGHGCGGANNFLEMGLPTMAEVFNRLGYVTGAFCRNSWVMDHETGCARGFSIHRHMPQADANPKETEAATTIREALKAVDQAESPFLMYLNSLEAHLRCWPLQPFRSRFLPDDATDDEAAAIDQGGLDIIAGRRSRSDREWEIMKALNDGETASLDAQIRVLVEEMKKRQLLDNTLFILMSDHGDTYDEHPGHHDHWPTAAWDTNFHTPLIIRFPDGMGKGKRIADPVQTCDILPTICDLLDIKDEELMRTPYQGLSFVETIDGKPRRDFTLSEAQKPLIFLDRLLRSLPD